MQAKQITQPIVVYGSTPCGIAAAIASARYGREVALVMPGSHVGGMMASGLSITDLRFPNAFGGIFEQFTKRIYTYYLQLYGPDSEQLADSNEGIWFEPHVAETVFEQMLQAESRITLYRNTVIERVDLDGDRVDRLHCRVKDSGDQLIAQPRVTIDASYEGDVAAASGAAYRVGREARSDYGEPYAGFIFLKNPGLHVLDGSTGEGDALIQAYNFRLCLTNRDDLRVLPQRPAAYDREEYAPLAELEREGKLRGMNDVIRLAPIPNGKFNGNNRPIIRSLDLPGKNTGYPDGTLSERAAIYAAYRDYMTGLLWFMQNDPELSEELRAETRTWGFCKDEFADNGHVPYELYVREARRIVGKKTFTSHDAFLAPGSERTPVHSDSVAVGDYHVDSHLVQRKQQDWPQIEGHVYLRPLSKPAQIPFGVMLPETVEGLLVPGALSATHLGFSVLRMEPPWMALGQAAGTAAHLALEAGVEPSEVPVSLLQFNLLAAGQVITFYYDVPGPDPIWQILNKPGERTKLDPSSVTPFETKLCPGIQYFGTKGFFGTYFARPYDPVTRSESARWLDQYLQLVDGEAGADAERQGGAGDTDQAARSAGPVYPDLPEAHPDYDIVTRLSKAGIVEAWRNTDGFFPGAALSRLEARRWFTGLLRAVGLEQETGRSQETPVLYKERLEALDSLHFITREQFCDVLYDIEIHRQHR
jgi:hypothetical protein